MKLKNRKLLILAGVLIIVLVCTAMLFITQKSSKKVSLELSDGDKKIANVYAQIYQLPYDQIIQIKAEKGSWEEVNQQIVKEKYMISDADKTMYIKEGYTLEDLYEADKLAFDSGVNANTIIKERGKKEEIKDWETVKKNLSLDTRSDLEKAGVSKKDIKELKRKKYSDTDISRIASVVFNSGKPYTDIIKEIENGTSLDDLENEIRDHIGGQR